MTNPIATWNRSLKRRLLVTAAAFACWTVAIEARLVYLQVYRRAELQARADRQHMRRIPSASKRGEITDRRGRILAYSVEAESVFAEPSEVEHPERTVAALCAVLDHCDARARQVMLDRLSQQRYFAYMRRKVSPEEARRVASLKLDGIGFVTEDRRFYPKRMLAAHLLGYVGSENTGLSGLEAVYDRRIRGRPGTIRIQTDAKHHAFSRVERPPTAGASVELTIDETLQHITERELAAGVRAANGVAGVAIVMDPHTGEILALANFPTFNPNAFQQATPSELRNRAIQDLYEPGSTFKIVTASAALEEQVFGVDHPIDVSAGLIRFGSRVINDVHRYGTLSFTDVVVKSSNVGAVKIGLHIGPERLSRYVRRFGFGRPLSPDFQGENPGIVWEAATLDDSALASVSMGYQVGVTPLQMAAAVSAIANGGELLEPHAVRAFLQDGRRVVNQPRVIRRAINATTAERLTTIMEQVVERGTATAAQIPGFTIAGKTGTAKKLVNGRYSASEYNASFVGFVPSRDPALTILVLIDSPRGAYYGGAVAAPVFGAIAEAALRHLGIRPTTDHVPPILVARQSDESPWVQPVHAPTAATAMSLPAVAEIVDGRPIVPQLVGMSAREAVRTLTRIGLTADLRGDGFVVDQFPPAGSAVEQGQGCSLHLGRTPQPESSDAGPVSREKPPSVPTPAAAPGFPRTDQPTVPFDKRPSR